MHKKPNLLLRVLVPVVVLAVTAAALVLGILRQSGQKPTSTPTQAVAPTQTDSRSALQTPAETPAAASPTPAATEPAATPPNTPARAISGLRAVEYDRQPLSALGDDTPTEDGGKYQLKMEFSPMGAGVRRLSLANHYAHADRKEHEVIQKFEASAANPNLGITPFAAYTLAVNDQSVNLNVNPADLTKTFWKEVGPGSFEATIVDATNTPVLKITRKYVLLENSYEFVISQRVENLSSTLLDIRWEQLAQADPPVGVIRYGGDPRGVRFGYMDDTTTNPERITQADGHVVERSTLLGKPINGYWSTKTLWPNDLSTKHDQQLVWFAIKNRYFSIAVHAPVDAAQAQGDGKVLRSLSTVERVVIPNPAAAQQRGQPGIVGIKASSPTQNVAPASSTDFSIAVYAGPQYAPVMRSETSAAAVGLDKGVTYSFGGSCGFCTFQTLTHLLLDFLILIHNYLTHDWGIAILLLVVCVRTILHPVTRWSQVNLLRFGKQMQKIAPKQKALQEKYKSDPVRLRQEIANLMREEKVNYAGALGCLPMFLQTPVWIALSAMLFFAFELRHQGAFFNVFQAVSGDRWLFLADLAEPDGFIMFGRSFTIPLLSGFLGPIDGLNLLPIVMGVLFYVQQKYLSPPTQTNLSPEMEQQQKIMKVMMVVMFPLFMYNAPSGLALYFLTNSALGILESKWIRSHVDKRELEAKPGSSTGWLARLQARAAEIQKQREQAERLRTKGRRR